MGCSFEKVLELHERMFMMLVLKIFHFLGVGKYLLVVYAHTTDIYEHRVKYRVKLCVLSLFCQIEISITYS